MSARSLTRPFRVVRARARSGWNTWLDRGERRRGAAHPARADRTPIFVLGAPRSGTTLLYQLLVEAFDVGWLANAHMTQPGGVSRIERRDHPRSARTPSTWESNYGATREAWEPNEGGEFWYRFVPRSPHELHDAHATPARVGAVRAAVREFADACASPVVFKNVYNSLRVPVLAAALPEAVFIVIDRALEANARSILVGRERNGGLGRWLSARPDGAEQLDAATPATQAVWQVQRMRDVAHDQLERLDDGRTLHVTYDELCSDPQGLVDRVDEWLTARGTPVPRRESANVPHEFDAKGGGRLSPEVEADLQEALRAAAKDAQA